MGVSVIPLYRDMREDVRIEVWDPGAAVMVPAPGGLEVFVLDGDFGQGGEGFSKHSWLRLPAADTLDAVAGSDGARVWIKSGHLRHVHN